MRRWLFIAGSVVVSAVFLWLTLRGVPLDDILDNIRQADVGWLAVSFASVVVGLLTRAVRWRGLVGNRVSVIRAYHIINVTFLLNQLPFRAGEVARSLLAANAGIPLVTAATSIIVERLLDTVLVVVVLAVALSQLPTVPDTASQLALLFGAAALVAFAVMIAFARYPKIPHRLLDWFEKLIPPVKRLNLVRFLDHILDGLRPLTNWRQAVHAIGWTLISWTFSIITIYSLELSLNITDVDIVLHSALGMTLASFSIAIPLSVAAIGPFEAAISYAGDLVGMSPDVSRALGFLNHGVAVISYAVLGVIGLLALGVSLGDVFKAAEQKEPETTDDPVAAPDLPPDSEPKQAGD